MRSILFTFCLNLQFVAKYHPLTLLVGKTALSSRYVDFKVSKKFRISFPIPFDLASRLFASSFAMGFMILFRFYFCFIEMFLGPRKPLGQFPWAPAVAVEVFEGYSC